MKKYQENYSDFGPTLASEKLTERDGLAVDHETLRRWLIAERIWQAKGRVERNHGVYQDRFVKELRLAGINGIEEANALLSESYLDTLNTKLARPPIDPEDAHVRLLRGQRLENILCFEERRVVAADYGVQFERRLLQIKRQIVVDISIGIEIAAIEWKSNHPASVKEVAPVGHLRPTSLASAHEKAAVPCRDS